MRMIIPLRGDTSLYNRLEGVTTMKKELLLPEMERVEEGLKDYIKSSSQQLNHLSSLLLDRGGKRLRPLLVILSSSIYATEEEIQIKVATAVELIHTASLIHDDVIDEASFRRGGVTINSHWDNKMAVLTGDHLFAQAFQLLTLYRDYDLLPIMTKTISLMCAGEINQLSMRGHIMSEDEYLKQIENKTASLLAASCYVGGKISSMPHEETRKLYNFGLNLGYGFQIIDDIFDLTGSRNLGKPTGVDLDEGIFTLPLIYLFQDQEYEPLIKELQREGGFTPSLKTSMMGALHGTGAIERSYEKALDYIEKALDELLGLPKGEPRELLHQLATYVVERDH